MTSPPQQLSPPPLPPQRAAPWPWRTVSAAAPYFFWTISRPSSRFVSLSRSVIRMSPSSTAARAAIRLGYVASQVRRERPDGLVVDAADHIFPAPVHRDQAREAKLLEVMRDRRV